MAKQDLTSIFAKTEPAKPGGGLEAIHERLNGGNIRSTGVGIRVAEIQAFDDIGRALGERLDSDPIPRNALMRIAIRRFLVAYLTGELTLDDLAELFDRPEKPKPKLRI